MMVTMANGARLPLSVVYRLMDEEIRDRLTMDRRYTESDEKFLAEYERRHEKKHGERFIK